MSWPSPSCETKISGANGDREIFIFPCSGDHEQDWQSTRLIYIAISNDQTYMYSCHLEYARAFLWSMGISGSSRSHLFHLSLHAAMDELKSRWLHDTRAPGVASLKGIPNCRVWSLAPCSRENLCVPGIDGGSELGTRYQV